MRINRTFVLIFINTLFVPAQGNQMGINNKIGTATGTKMVNCSSSAGLSNGLSKMVRISPPENSCLPRLLTSELRDHRGQQCGQTVIRRRLLTHRPRATRTASAGQKVSCPISGRQCEVRNPAHKKYFTNTHPLAPTNPLQIPQPRGS